MPTLWIQIAFMPTWNIHVTVLECPQMKIIKDVLNSVWRALCFVWAVRLSCVRDAINWHVWILIIRPQLPNHCIQDDHTFHNLFCPPVQNHSQWQSLNYNTNIRDVLVRSLLHQPAPRTPGTNKQNVEHVLSPAQSPTLLALSPRWTSWNSSTAWHTTLHFSLRWDSLYTGETGSTFDTRFKEHCWYIKTLERETCC